MKKEIEKIIRIIENAINLKIKGGRGYSAGHPYEVKKVKPVYGNSKYEEEEVIKKIEQDTEAVQVSRAFQRKEDQK